MGMSLKYLAGFLLVGAVLYSSGRQDGNMEPFSLYLFGLLFVWRFSVWRHPNRRCWRCEGRSRHFGSFFRYAQRLCTGCEGKGRKRRLGARVFGVSDISPRHE